MDNIRSSFVHNINEAILNYAKKSSEESKDFKVGSVEMVEDLKLILASVLASAGAALKMDREKFCVLVNEIGQELKAKSIELYEITTENPTR